MSHDELEFLLPAPVSKAQAMEVAVEQYGFLTEKGKELSDAVFRRDLDKKAPFSSECG